MPWMSHCKIALWTWVYFRKTSPDLLLDIWVNVRGMDWAAAVVALAELGRRCLLSFKKGRITNADIGRAIEWKTAGDLVFTQHDVLRDLALQLADKEQRKSRLVMPGMNIRSNLWQSEKSCGAEVIAIHTGGANKFDLLAGLAFPNAQALLLDIRRFESGLETNCLPTLISRMRPTLEFSCLQHLDLRHCNGLENLPESFRQLRRLQHLSLEWCDELKYLPESFGQLSRLQYLSLYCCTGLRNLPESFGQLSRLQYLSLYCCTGLRNLPESFGQLSRLQCLSLERSRALEGLPESSGQLSGVQHLSLERCRALEGLPESFGQLSGLQHLSLERCRALEGLPESFGQLSRLQYLSLKGCTQLECLPQSLLQVRTLVI
ncbi:hypothetical protein L7F22_065329 [Adiantum nelumboides]|nr:hypothetical protein [Adiantum nelumboides]